MKLNKVCAALAACGLALGMSAASAQKLSGDKITIGFITDLSSLYSDLDGPAGVEAVVEGFNIAYATDKGYRVAHHGEAIAPSSGFGGTAVPFELDAAGNAIVLNEGGLTIEAFKVEHDPVEPSVGYRITYKGRTAVISGDAEKSAAV